MIDFLVPTGGRRDQVKVRQFMTKSFGRDGRRRIERSWSRRRHDRQASPQGSRRVGTVVAAHAKEWRHGPRANGDGGGVGGSVEVGIGPFVLNAQAPDEGNQTRWNTGERPSRRRSTSAAVRGHGAQLLRDDRTRSRRQRPDVDPDPRLRDGDEWIVTPQVVHLGARGASSRCSSRAPKKIRRSRKPRTAASSSICERRLEHRPRRADDERGHNHCEILIETCASRTRTCSRPDCHLPVIPAGPARLAPACVARQAELAST